jgi:hypothetical protein
LEYTQAEIRMAKPNLKVSMIMECGHSDEREVFLPNSYDVGEYHNCKDCNQKKMIVETRVERIR